MKILVCTDGQPHSIGGIKQAITFGLSNPADVTGLYVADPWLKKFYSELYSQGRKQYLDYVDECLQSDAAAAQRQFTEMCQAAGVAAEFKIRYGEPLAEILNEVKRVSPDVLITGRKPLGQWGKFRSRNLPVLLRSEIGNHAEFMSIAQAA